MADLSNIPMDPDVKENDGAFTVLPPGIYKMVIIADQLRDAKSGNGKVLEVKLQVVEGPHVGDTVTDYINLVSVHAQAQAIGQGTLKKICNLCGVQYPPADTTGLYGKPMMVKVAVEEFTSNTGKQLKSNKVKSYAAVESPQATTTSNGGSW